MSDIKMTPLFDGVLIVTASPDLNNEETIFPWVAFYGVMLQDVILWYKDGVFKILKNRFTLLQLIEDIENSGYVVKEFSDDYLKLSKDELLYLKLRNIL